MPFELPSNLHPDLVPIAWLIGRWEGRGKGAYPGIGDFYFVQ